MPTLTILLTSNNSLVCSHEPLSWQSLLTDIGLSADVRIAPDEFEHANAMTRWCSEHKHAIRSDEYLLFFSFLPYLCHSRGPKTHQRETRRGSFPTLYHKKRVILAFAFHLLCFSFVIDAFESTTKRVVLAADSARTPKDGRAKQQITCFQKISHAARNERKSNCFFILLFCVMLYSCNQCSYVNVYMERFSSLCLDLMKH